MVNRNSFADFIKTLKLYPEAYRFIKANKLWLGFEKYKVVAWAMIIAALALGLKAFQIFSSGLKNSPDEGVIGMSLGSIFSAAEVMKEGYQFLFVGGFRYVVLLLLEVLIFHFALKTIEKLSGRAYKITLSDFIHAQFRMLKVIIFNFGVEIFVGILLAFALGILGLEWAKSALMFVLQAFLLGFMIMDNFNEIQGAGVRTSFKRTRQYLGAAVGIGLPLYFIMLVPVIGTVLGPILAIVAASLFMYEVEPHLLDEDDFLEDALV